LGGGSALLAGLLAAHLAFGTARYVGGAWHKRSETIAEFERHGELWFFRHADRETQELVRWLLATAPKDAVILYDGNSRELVEALHAALFPRVLLHRRALQRPEGLSGRTPFGQHPPTVADPPATPGWVQSQGNKLRWRAK
jgi:hypothetical protein